MESVSGVLPRQSSFILKWFLSPRCSHVLHPANVVLSHTQGTISSGRLDPFHFLPRRVHPDLQIREAMLQKYYNRDTDDLILVSGSTVGCSS